MRSFVTIIGFLSVAIGFLSAAATVLAEPLVPAKLPNNAKWVIHIDHNALTDTVIMKQTRKQHADVVQQVRQWMQADLGVDPQEELHGLTMFSDTYERHTGAAILQADFDQEKVQREFAAKSGVEQTQWQGHTLYTWNVKREMHYAARQAEQGGPSSRAQSGAAPVRSDSDRSANKTVTAVLFDQKNLVLAPNVDRAKSVVQLLAGDAPSLKGQDSKLITEVPDDAFCYGAAIELEKIGQQEGVFPILRQHEHIRWSIGERDGELFEKITMIAQDEEVAERMKSGLEGLVALVQVWAADTKKLAQLYRENLSIQRDGTTVQVDWKGDAQDVVAAMDEVKERFQQWLQTRS